MKKGQGASKRKTLMEAIYGPAAAGEAGKHIDLLAQKRHVAAAIEINRGAIEDGLGDIPQMKKNVIRLKRLGKNLEKKIAESWEAAMKRPFVMGQISKISEIQKNNPMGCAYHADFVAVCLYDAWEAKGERIPQ